MLGCALGIQSTVCKLTGTKEVLVQAPPDFRSRIR